MSIAYHHDTSYYDAWIIVADHVYGSQFSPKLHDNIVLRDTCIDYLVGMCDSGLIELGYIRPGNAHAEFIPYGLRGEQLREHLRAVLPEEMGENRDEGFKCWYILTPIGEAESKNLVSDQD